MALIPTHNEIIKLVEAFGFNGNLMYSFKLIIEVDSIVTIEAGMYPTKEEIKSGADATKVIMKKYELVEKEE